ncbi:MAG: hypothetical protein JWM95_4545 [Gemmatimonadetes bacterium]|nr:hypothetical protein [Gemmatimonadota bacterium]
MSYFGTLRHGRALLSPNSGALPFMKETAPATRTEAGHAIRSFGANSKTVTASRSDLRDQFVLLQFGKQDGDARVLHTDDVVAIKSGSDTQPDILCTVQLSSFHVSADEEIAPDTKATLRLDLGKDDSSRSELDTLFWSVAAGLSLFDTGANVRSEPRKVSADFRQALSKRPIEIPGGLGRMSFEIVKHREPSWWKKVFSFLQSKDGTRLASAIGFPALTSSAIALVDEIFNRLDGDAPEVLFKSYPLTLALSARARTELEAGQAGVTVGVLNPGSTLVVRARDLATIVSAKPVFMSAYGLLKPSDMPSQQFLMEPEANPFSQMTYAVIRVGVTETRLAPVMDFGDGH